MQDAGDGNGAKRHMGKPVSDKGEAAQHKGDAQQGRTQGDQHADDQGIPNERKLKIPGQGIDHADAPPS